MHGTRSSLVFVSAFVAMLSACAAEQTPVEAPQANAPPAVTADPAATPAAPVETAAPEAQKAPEPVKPPKPASEKLRGKFVQQWSGELKDTGEAAAKKAAGAKDKDGKKYQALVDKAMAAAGDVVIEGSADTLVWNVKGKTAHTAKFEVSGKADDPASVTLKLAPAGPKAKPQEVAVTFSDDDTFSMKDPFAKDAKKALTLVFKRTP
jgi:hypothetical protein